MVEDCLFKMFFSEWRKRVGMMEVKLDGRKDGILKIVLSLRF